MHLPQSTLVLFAQTMLVAPFVVGIFGFVGLASKLRQSTNFSRWFSGTTLFISVILLFIGSLMILAPVSEYPLRFSLLLRISRVDFYIDSLSLYFILLVNLIALFATWNALYTVDTTLTSSFFHHPTFFYASINLFHFTMLLVPMVDNLIGLWIAIEATTLVSALLVSYRNTHAAWEAAWKYLIITSTGIILALLGTMFLANAVQKPASGEILPDSVMNWTELMAKAHAGALQADFVKLAFLFILVGYGTKAGLAPMHTWLPDGHGEAPAPISALLSGVLLKCALYAILRFYTITNTVLGSPYFTSTVLLGAGLFSILLATPFILNHKNYRFKRVLAYHSLEHMGIITFGIGIGGPVALFGALLHVLNHAVTKSLMFLAFGNVMREYRRLNFEQDQITGVLRAMPKTGALLALGGLALVGTPPFNIFMSEWIILWGALARLTEPLTPAIPPFSRWIIVFVVILFMCSTTLIFYGLVRHLGKLLLHKIPNDQRLPEGLGSDLLPIGLLLLIALAFGLTVISPIANLITASVNILLISPS